MYKIPLLDLKAQYGRIKVELHQALEEVLESQQFILGSVVQRFEQQVASYLRSGSAIGVASGSDALLLSLMALEIGAGDAVLVPPFTFFATVSAITRLGATPIFVDVDPETCLIDSKAVETILARSRVTSDGRGLLDPKSQRRIKAILPVHLFGQSCTMGLLTRLAKKHHLHLMEDVAQAFGTRTTLSNGKSKFAGTIGDLGCFSFFPTKMMGAMGDGGLVITDEKELADKIRTLRVHGQSSKYHHQVVGLNSRLDAMQAAILSVKLRHIDQWCEERIERAGLYQKLFLASGLVGKRILTLPTVDEKRSHVYNYYVTQVQQRDDLKRYLEEHGIQSEVYYPLPLHLQPCFSYLGCHKGDFPNAELAASRVLALPMYPELTPEQQELIVQRVADFYHR